MATTFSIPSIGDVEVIACRGEVQRVTKYPMERGQEWVVTLSGHKKGTNPRIKNDNGRLWAVSVPFGTSIPNIGDGPAIYAVPAANSSLVCQLQLYKRQVVKEACTFSLTNGADRCYLRDALEHNEFHFVFARASEGEVQWFVTEEYFTITRNMSTTRSKTLEKKRMEAELAKQQAVTAVDALAATANVKVKMEQVPGYSSLGPAQTADLSALDSFFSASILNSDQIFYKLDEEPPPYSPVEQPMFSWDASNGVGVPDVLDQVMNDVPWAADPQLLEEKAKVMDMDMSSFNNNPLDVVSALSWLPNIDGCN